MNKPNVNTPAPGSRKARREANAKAREQDKAREQAATIALRASQERGWTVAVTFRAGAHDVKIVRTGTMPAGYSEARVATRERARLAAALRQGTPPALRYSEAEGLANALRNALARSRGPVRRVAGEARRRWA